MKRTLIITAAILLMTVVLAACANGGSSKGGDGPGGEITFFYWDDNQREAMDKVIVLLKDIAPDVSVESTIIPWGQYWTTLQISLTSAAEPDVFWVNKFNSLDYIPAGLMEPIGSYIERDEVDMSVFPQALIDLYSADGAIYAIPKDFDTIALFYNRSLFDAKGMDYPEDTWTWDDLKDAAIALTEGNVYGFAAQAWTQGTVHPWMLSNGGKVLTPDGSSFDVNYPENIEAVQWLVDAMYVHGFSPDGPSQRELDPTDMFLAGNIAMHTGGSWAVSWFLDMMGDDLGVASLPISRQPASIINGLGIAMSARSENKEAAWMLQKAFTLKEAGEAQAGSVIPAIVGTEHLWVESFPSLNLQCFVNAASYATPNPAPRVASAEQQAVFDDALQNIWMQTEDVA